MKQNYKKINDNLFWLCVISLLLYFIFLPINHNRPNPNQQSLSESENTLRLEANPLFLFKEETDIRKILNQTTSSATSEFPQALTPIIE
ncbi:MAG: hypothetical protein KatS3mg095_0047 [Candidatus Parcubacteria bacterium]|nr:MAG: hypothetical protein KatS3mg095_0047 [Candidatus Parcubacteria bacterium]